MLFFDGTHKEGLIGKQDWYEGTKKIRRSSGVGFLGIPFGDERNDLGELGVCSTELSHPRVIAFNELLDTGTFEGAWITDLDDLMR